MFVQILNVRKKLFDSRYAYVKRWVDKCMRKMMADASCVTDLIILLQHRGGLPNTPVELIRLRRSSDHIAETIEAQRNNK